VFEGELLGGCIDSMGEMLLAGNTDRYDDLVADVFESLPQLRDDFAMQAEITRKFGIFPSAEDWRGKVLFAETSEVAPSPEMLGEYISALKNAGVFDMVNGIIIGKPMNELYYEEYKDVWRETVDVPELPMLYNVNFGHAAPRAILPYGAVAHIDADRQEITLL
jgi:muramoyltetrapeptide carboxypeptidase LdcA involved in peptidoglycan recycling